MVSDFADQLIYSIYRSRQKKFSDCVASIITQSTISTTRNDQGLSSHQISSLANDICSCLDGVGGLLLPEPLRVPPDIQTVDEFLLTYATDFLWESEQAEIDSSHVDFGRWAAAIVIQVFIAELQSSYARVSNVVHFFRALIFVCPTDHVAEIAIWLQKICMDIEGLSSLDRLKGIEIAADGQPGDARRTDEQ